jgi:hypothetical protein
MHPVESTVPSKHPCPNCGSIRVHRSRRRGLAERILCLAGARVKSCHQCGLRFLRYRSITLPVADTVRILRRLSYLAVAVIGVLLVLVAIAWYGKRSAEGAGEVGQASWPVVARTEGPRQSEQSSLRRQECRRGSLESHEMESR